MNTMRERLHEAVIRRYELGPTVDSVIDAILSELAKPDEGMIAAALQAFGVDEGSDRDADMVDMCDAFIAAINHIAKGE